MAEPTDDAVPAWKQESVERSLRTARARAHDRTDRFVAAAIDLMQDSGSIDFTVQDVVDRSRMSIRTFYNFFASKDDLLIAVHETVLAGDLIARLRERCGTEDDPVRRVRAYIDGLCELGDDAGPVSRALTTYRNRLAETRPADLDRAFQPLIGLLAELVTEATASGRLRSGLTPAVAAHMLHHAVLAAIHTRILNGDRCSGVEVEELWAFCAHGLGAEPPSGGTS